MRGSSTKAPDLVAFSFRLIQNTHVRSEQLAIRIHNLTFRFSTYLYPGTSVADPDPGSGAILPQGSGIRDEFFPDPGSQT
jgi:hypothetical protein